MSKTRKDDGAISPSTPTLRLPIVDDAGAIRGLAVESDTPQEAAAPSDPAPRGCWVRAGVHKYDIDVRQTMTFPLAMGPHRLRRSAIILRDPLGRLRAYMNLCKHLPIPIDGGSGDLLDDDRLHLICRTHGALYRMKDGVCIEGPCTGETLDVLTLRDGDDGMLEIWDELGDPGPQP